MHSCSLWFWLEDNRTRRDKKKKKMSWPSIWQSQNQPPANASQVPMNAGMYAQLTPEQQYLMQQQNWQQWQMFQQQYAQWHAQYGEQVSYFSQIF